MPTVVLVFRGPRKHTLGDLGELDARTLAEELRAPPTPAGKKIADRLDAAARATEGESVEVVLEDRDQLEIVHQTCVESITLKTLPTFDRLRAELARVRDAPG